jgi:hypothetical protein
VADLLRRWDKKTLKFRYVKTAKPKSKEKFSRYVITVARRISAQGLFTGSYQVEIRSEQLREILSEIYRNADGISFGSPVALDEEELKLLYHARTALAAKLQEATEAKDENLIFELKSLLEFTNEHFNHVISELDDLPTGQITFESLWTLFPPNTVAHSKDKLKQVKVVRVRSSGYSKKEDGSVEFRLSTDYLDSDGRQVGYVWPQRLTINQFRGSMPIQQLQCYPTLLHPQFEELRRELILRGQRLLSLHGRHFQQYEGHALQEHKRQFFGDEETTSVFNVCASLSTVAALIVVAV